MPWALIFRLGWVVLAALGFARRRRNRGGATPTRDLAGRAASVRALVAVGLAVVTVTVIAAFAIVALTAALTLSGPGPRWLAAVFAGAGVVAAGAAVVETGRARARLQRLRRERHLRAAARVADADAT